MVHRNKQRWDLLMYTDRDICFQVTFSFSSCQGFLSFFYRFIFKIKINLLCLVAVSMWHSLKDIFCWDRFLFMKNVKISIQRWEEYGHSILAWRKLRYSNSPVDAKKMAFCGTAVSSKGRETAIAGHSWDVRLEYRAVAKVKNKGHKMYFPPL